MTMGKIKNKFKSSVWWVVLFYGISTLFGSFNAKSSHFDIQFLTVSAVSLNIHPSKY